MPTNESDLATWQTTNYVPQTTYETTTKTVDDVTTYTHRLLHTRSGNVYAGGMGRNTQLDGETVITAVDWYKLGNVKSTKLTISGNPWIMGNVYGGGEFGAVQGKHATDNFSTEVNITGGTIGTEITESAPQKNTVTEAGVVKYTYGSVFGAGNGIYYYVEPTTPVAEANKLSAYVAYDTKVSVTDATVRASVYGGGELSAVGGDTYVTINGNTKIGRNEVQSKGGSDPGYVMFGGWRMGNVYGGGRGHETSAIAGLVKGNTNVLIENGVADATYAAAHEGVSVGDALGSPKIYHNVYGGGALGSVGMFFVSGADPSDGGTPQGNIPTGVPYWTIGPEGASGGNTGVATVTIKGGTIGISGRDNGLVFGSSRGDISDPNTYFTQEEIDAATEGTPAYGKTTDDIKSSGVDQYDRVAWVRGTVVNIGEQNGDRTTPLIKGSVYGGGENGHNYQNAAVNVYSGTIGIADVIPGTGTPDPWWDFGNADLNEEYRAYRGNVYGAGSGSDTYTKGGKEYNNPRAGMVGGSAVVNIAGGHIGRSVYGGGAMASLGNIVNPTDTIEGGSGKHSNIENSFALSWPYKFEFAPMTGKATVNVTGGHIGTKQVDGGDVYGSARGVAGDRYATAHMAYAKETVVNINYSETAEMTSETAIQDDYDIPCITGSVHGSGENGFVYDDATVTLTNGLIGHSLYGAGKGSGKYKQKLLKIGATKGSANLDDYYDAEIYSLIAGKVFGNTYVTMNGGHVGRNVYGGGNMGSVGKGNYAGGSDDYANDSPIGAIMGYGETLNGNAEAAYKILWTPSANFNPSKPIVMDTDPVPGPRNIPETMADYFLSSGKATVKVLGGVVGYIDEEPNVSMKNQLPYGNVFGGSAGVAAPNVANDPSDLYLYSPAFFSGYVNETDVTIGAEGTPGPTIYSSVYGGGQDGHVRRDTKVTVLSGEIGKAYTSENQTLLKTSNPDDPQWLHRGNIYGGGSGITKYSVSNVDEMYVGSYTGDKIPASDFSTSSGSVTRFTEVNIKGGTIHRNVYGGGSNGSVGAPNMGQTYDPYRKDDPADGHGVGKQSQNTVNIGGGQSVVTIGTPFDTTKGWSYNKTYGGEVYGACRGMSTLDPNQYANSVWTQVNIFDKATIMGNVYGGGDNGITKKDAEVRIGDPVTP